MKKNKNPLDEIKLKIVGQLAQKGFKQSEHYTIRVSHDRDGKFNFFLKRNKVDPKNLQARITAIVKILTGLFQGSSCLVSEDCKITYFLNKSEDVMLQEKTA